MKHSIIIPPTKAEKYREITLSDLILMESPDGEIKIQGRIHNDGYDTGAIFSVLPEELCETITQYSDIRTTQIELELEE